MTVTQSHLRARSLREGRVLSPTSPLPQPCRYKLEVKTGQPLIVQGFPLFKGFPLSGLCPIQNTFTWSSKCKCINLYKLISKCSSVEGMSSDKRKSSPVHPFPVLSRSNMSFSISDLPLSYPPFYLTSPNGEDKSLYIPSSKYHSKFIPYYKSYLCLLYKNWKVQRILWSWERLKTGGEGDNRWWDGWVSRHHQLNGHEFEQALRDDGGQGSLACCSPWGCKELDMTEQLNTNTNKEFLKINITRKFNHQKWPLLMFWYNYFQFLVCAYDLCIVRIGLYIVSYSAF